MDRRTDALREKGFALLPESFADPEEAFAFARSLIESCSSEEPVPLSIVGDFVLPPVDGSSTRDFQTLHFDFGLPLDPRVDQDIARYTALHVVAGAPGVTATTRLVPLGPLLQQRSWPPVEELLENLLDYGRSHGAWDDALGYVEGSLARIVEGATGAAPELPSVKTDEQFLCGLEFESLRAELTFFARHQLRIEEVAVDVPLQPGELLVFDNLALAHGRCGARAPGELRQRVFGLRRLEPSAQCRLRDRVLGAFYSPAAASMLAPLRGLPQ